MGSFRPRCASLGRHARPGARLDAVDGVPGPGAGVPQQVWLVHRQRSAIPVVGVQVGNDLQAHGTTHA